MTELTHAGGVVVHDGEVLIVTSSSGYGWVLPKGLIDPGEAPEDAAVREVEEEAGLVCEIVAMLGDVDIEKADYIARTRFFLMTVVETVEASEDRDKRWCDFATAKQLVNSNGAREALALAESKR